MITLELEFRDVFRKAKTSFKVGRMTVVCTPPISEDYWVFRIKLYKKQSLIAFPKFGTVGIGFAVEDDDWNTNLPHVCQTLEIYNHIKCNKKYNEITKTDCMRAISILQKASKYYAEHEMEADEINNEDNLNGLANYVDRLEKFTSIRTKTL